jgi:thiol-disulfide isomerase/thioredoxin
MSAITLGPSVRQRALRGALEGACGGGLVCLFGYLSSQDKPDDFWWLRLLLFVSAGALLFGLGRAISAGLVGAVAGGGLGLLFGVLYGPLVPGSYTYVQARPVEVRQPRQVLEIAGPTLDGKQFDLKDLRGKVVLVDFWATWCLPCVAEVPEVRKLYEKHHHAGFEVVGVSLDHDRQRLEGFVESYKLPWPQIFYKKENRDERNPLALRYEVETIPTLFLVDREGREVARVDSLGAVKSLLPALLLPPVLDGEGKDTGQRLQEASVPVGQYAAQFLACLGGGVGGALIERRLRRPAA